MILLVIDIGNTHIEIGLYEAFKYVGSWRIATGANRTEDELMIFIQQFMSQKGIPTESIKDVAISSVVPNITQIFCKLSLKYFFKEPLIVDCNLDLGIQIDYDPPGSVGADRLCNAVAAFSKYGGPVVVVDIGTGTTLDVISKDGVYLGGVIAPGLETAAWGLHERASKLPKISFEYPPSVIGKNTEWSMQSGIMYGTAKLIDGLIEMIAEELKEQPRVLATGGLSKILAPESRYIKEVDSHLVLDGIIKIYLRNRLRQDS